MTVLRSGSASDVGRVRAINEDRALESLSLYAVADGMGGHAGGEVAARTAIDALQAAFAASPSGEGLVEAVRRANGAVWQRSLADPDLRGMGTTLIAAALVPGEDGDRLVLTNVGDSRAYRYNSGTFEQLTVDHSVAEELLARGELTEEEAAVHPHRHILTRALGIAPDVDVDVWEISPTEGDRFLLCSDGLSNEVSGERMAAALSSSRDPQEIAEELVVLANEHGGSDNITAVVVDVVVGDKPPGASLTPDVFVIAGDQAPGVGDPGAGEPGTGEPGTGEPGAGDPGVGDPGAVAGDASGLATQGRARRPGVVNVIGPARSSDAQPPQPAAVATGLTAGQLHSARGTTGMAPRMTFPARAEPAPTGARRPTSQPVVFKPPRRLTFRVAVFVLVFAAVVAAAWGVINWYVDHSYYVGLRQDEVVIFQGRPGGFLWLHPHVVATSGLTTAHILPYHLASLRSGVQEPSLGAARAFVANLRSESQATIGGGTSTTSTTGGGTSTTSTTAGGTARGMGVTGSGGTRPTGMAPLGSGITSQEEV